MYIKNDIVYANGYDENKTLKVTKIKIVAELCMLVTFSNGEKKIFDASKLLTLPVYEKLSDNDVFNSAKIEKWSYHLG